ncbi:nucleotide-diphospho-sugar transferase [Fennellomyces sp. T-0311]|nr:nucleotide-diphospho-sugar transferase [Fennellomyces sp. T-0311]
MASIQSFKRRTSLRTITLLSFLLCFGYAIWSFIPNHRRRQPLVAYEEWPPYVNPVPLQQPHDNFRAAHVTLTKGDSESLANLRKTIRQLQDAHNHARGYPYIIFSDETLSDEFKHLAKSMAPNADVAFFDELGPKWYGYSNSTDRDLARQARERMNETIFGDSEDYRFAARFMSGLMFRHPALAHMDYIWRFEPGTEYPCPVLFDPIAFMHDNNKKVSFSIALYEYEETIPSLFGTMLKFAGEHPHGVQDTDNDQSLWSFVIDKNTQGFNRCHFWNNFQIADVRFFRGPLYQSYFNFIDQSNGIFYERWGDPVIQSLGVVLFLEKSDVQFWENIGYRVANYFTHCPSNKFLFKQCSCRPVQNFDNDGYSCLTQYMTGNTPLLAAAASS